MKYFFIFSIVLTTSFLNCIINVPDDYSTIQAAINSSSDNDTILVQPGTYQENINFDGKKIILTSRFFFSRDPEDITQTIIDGNENDCVVTFESGETQNTRLIGFSITNGDGSGPDLSSNGGGIGCRNNSNPCLENLYIFGNTSSYGAGIFCDESNPTITDCSIFENDANDFPVD